MSYLRQNTYVSHTIVDKMTVDEYNVSVSNERGQKL
jgi:hypothetical protein